MKNGETKRQKRYKAYLSHCPSRVDRVPCHTMARYHDLAVGACKPNKAKGDTAKARKDERKLKRMLQAQAERLDTIQGLR